MSDLLHFRKPNLSPLCGAMQIRGGYLRSTPDSPAVTCPRCQRLLQAQRKAKPMRAKT